MIAAAVTEAIAACLPERDYAVELRHVPTVQLGRGEIEMRVVVPAAAAAGGGHRVTVELRRGGTSLRVLRLPIDVRRWVDGLVLVAPLRRGEAVAAADVRRERRLLEGPAQPLAALDDAAGLRARRTLAAGRLLVAGDLEPLPLVHRNAPVDILLERGAIRIELRGVALADGWQGDRIRVRNPLTRRALTAVVSGAGQVVVGE